MSVRLGIDTGGTFTDFVLLDEETGEVRTVKVPSTPQEPARAIAAGLTQLVDGAKVDQVVVGTTIATNAVLERRGPTLVYVASEGFQDVPFIGRLDKEYLYDLHWQKPKPLVLRRHCLGIRERVDYRGRVVEQLEESTLEELCQRLRACGEDVVVAVCLLFSYLRPEHELAVRAAVERVLPDSAVSLSHEVSPLWREYERASTTLADAFVKPAIESYVNAVGETIRQRLALERWNLLGSNGGYLSADEARGRPAQLLLSGLAGGVIGGRFFAQAAGRPAAFTLDMGGTSCDLGLVLEGSQQYASEFELAWGLPVTIPCVAVKTIGAGGGSIAWIDKGDLLHVGPGSAGAEPGPVAYGQGGAEPTLTDANLTLGRLNPEYFLGGAMRLDSKAAQQALEALGDQLGLSAEEAALAAVRTADENMANAIRLIAVERGLDPRAFSLIAFGGAGPLHARAVAERLGIATVVIPAEPGLCSALGCAITEARIDRVQSYYARSDQVQVGQLAEVERRLRERAIADLRRSVAIEEPILRRSADMRYAGQNYELEVDLPEGDLDATRWSELLGQFDSEHERQFGFALHGEPVELINLRVTALRPELQPALGAASADEPLQSAEVREVWFEGREAIDCPIYRRDLLPRGAELSGPAIVEEDDSTTLLFPGDRGVVEANGTLVLTVGGHS
jgi:N-methylhydantoinase A